jgi:hypothetical protein
MQLQARLFQLTMDGEFLLAFQKHIGAQTPYLHTKLTQVSKHCGLQEGSAQVPIPHLESYQQPEDTEFVSRVKVRALAQEYPDGPWEELLHFHHSPIAHIRKTKGPSVCVTVPNTGQFLQNGFVLGNSQGSEYPISVLVIDDSEKAKRVACRELLYTAISRAKKRCLLIGRRAVADEWSNTVTMRKRKTMLAHEIREQIQVLVSANISRPPKDTASIPASTAVPEPELVWDHF